MSNNGDYLNLCTLCNKPINQHDTMTKARNKIYHLECYYAANIKDLPTKESRISETQLVMWRQQAENPDNPYHDPYFWNIILELIEEIESLKQTRTK